MVKSLSKTPWKVQLDEVQILAHEGSEGVHLSPLHTRPPPPPHTNNHVEHRELSPFRQTRS